MFDDIYNEIYEVEPTPIYELGEIVAWAYPNGHIEWCYEQQHEEDFNSSWNSTPILSDDINQ